MKRSLQRLSNADISHIVALAWADGISFEAIKQDTGLSEPEVIAVMRQTLKTGSYRTWRKRMRGHRLKHGNRSGDITGRHPGCG